MLMSLHAITMVSIQYIIRLYVAIHRESLDLIFVFFFIAKRISGQSAGEQISHIWTTAFSFFFEIAINVLIDRLEIYIKETDCLSRCIFLTHISCEILISFDITNHILCFFSCIAF
jgi:hypothetical protein